MLFGQAAPLSPFGFVQPHPTHPAYFLHEQSKRVNNPKGWCSDNRGFTVEYQDPSIQIAVDTLQGDPIDRYGLGDPIDPYGPGDPIDPYGPGDPVDPYGPGDPIDPYGPGDPIDPYGPGDPIDPYGQGDPIDPYGPGDPIDPYGQGDPIGSPFHTDCVLWNNDVRKAFSNVGEELVVL